MRVFLVILMMALLPLRVGLGDVMAMEAGRMDVQVAAQHPAAQHDCHEARQHAAADPSDHQASPADGMQADHECGDCQVCHVTALPGTLLSRVLAPTGSAPPQTLVVTPVSADPVPGLKPPIA